MVVRQTRIVATLMLATILAIALGSVLWLGTSYPFLVKRNADGNVLSVTTAGHAALMCGGNALLWHGLCEWALRVRRWRRNIIRAGGIFATSWIGSLTLVLAMQMMALADVIGQPFDHHRAFAIVVAVLLLFKANLLPKSRPGWFNGVTFPLFVRDPDVWRRVHRASAIRIAVVAVATLLMAVASGPDPLPIVMRLLMAELCGATLHGLWLGRRPGRKRVARS
ncbi:hypothetical protein SAMN05444678_103229 [Sphingomonas sp. YR710]|uniref:hypothetical protein n=1 Tax=Sphingomonas sp. YR710 TaxID=1882773 RepID=UPI00088977B2|nr:hypothetical protein [Sphingomonas sp. YR710]SDC50955.1 hypothetical protein SAMN05444678_103229 [Sphingomonas sp. YR710]